MHGGGPQIGVCIRQGHLRHAPLRDAIRRPPLSRFRRFDRPYREAQAGRGENGRQTAQFRIAGLREHAVHGFPCELRPARHGGDPSMRHRDLPKREHQRPLMTSLDHGLEVAGRFLGILENRVPLIYFLGAFPGHYHAIIPVTIVGWDARSLRAQVSMGLPGELRADPQETTLERRYALRQVKARLHQTLFRAAVIAAYGGRCALSGPPETSLLDAAHIAADGDELLGQPIVTNGLPLTKLHHAAFDNRLIGVVHHAASLAAPD